MTDVETLAGIITRTPILAVDEADDAARHAYARAIAAWRQDAARALAAVAPPALGSRMPTVRQCEARSTSPDAQDVVKGRGWVDSSRSTRPRPHTGPLAEVISGRAEFRNQDEPFR